MEIKDKHVIATGAGAGFGRMLVETLADEGALVAGFDIDQKKLIEIGNYSKNIFPIDCDVSDYRKTEKAVKIIAEEFGKVDILINNAGIMKNAPLVNLLDRNDRKHSVELWQSVIDVNLSSVFYMTRCVADLMISKRTKGVIVNVSSIAAKGNIGQTAYSASKAGVEAMSKVWAKELGVFGIRCAAVAPGFINTQGAHDALEKRRLSKWVEKTPLKRTGEVNEVISSIFYIIKNDFFNGQVLHIDGGLKI